ncbi:hypothetical protein GRI43_01735 [Altererythrobacter luteolus]|uniref:Peptidase M15A C-terminal domain-containing protein n=1 Tax=Pontixanthobacter luteolus TaxID=295089 RepID=A0A6I4V2D5_9SPHN|nr:D-Ala-D-Ala carboxypeptidase family metallohydrolase [Pontixanthobacter luteolus]MXP46112.1 hypothetical protein [Pontixanthobacter luteolus]
MRRLSLILVFVCVAGLVLWLFARPGEVQLVAKGEPYAYSRAAFDKWVVTDPDRRGEFEAFGEFLASHDVGDVVPAWELTRTDANRSNDCERPAFLIPPRDKWMNIIPVLTLMRDQIVPEIGKVEVQSSYRTTDFNACVGGARRSRHLEFSAVDLVPVGDIANADLFRRLCAVQRNLGPQSRLGLGAYFDPEKADNASGRFHLDVSGYRSWGYSQRSESSGCRAFF